MEHNGVIGKMRTIISHPLALGSAFVFAGSMISNVAAYVYHLAVGRTLGPIGYGELSSLISLLYLFGVPVNVLQTVLVKFFSTYKANGSVSNARFLFSKAFHAILIAVGIFAAVTVLASPMVGNFLHLTNNRYIIWIALTFVFSTLVVVNTGVTQGFQLFYWVGSFTAVTALLRLGFGVYFARWGVEMTIASGAITTMIMYALYYLPIRFIFKEKPKAITLTKKDIIKFSIPTFLTMLGITSLFSTDIILVRHFFDANSSGVYSAVAVLGKVIYFASSAVTLVVFPMISEKVAKREDSNRLITLSMLAVSGISVLITTMYFLIPDTITHLLFGTSFLSASAYLGIFGIFISLFSVAQLFLMSCLAIGNTKVWILSLGAAVLQILGIIIFHSSLTDIITVNIGVSLVLTVSVLVFHFFNTRHE